MAGQEHLGFDRTKSKHRKESTSMNKRIAILVMAMGMCMGLVNRVTPIALAQPQDEKTQSDGKMKDDKMKDDKMAGDKMGKKKSKKHKKDKMDKMDKMDDKGKMDDQKN
jgi:hypothetical protein